jgi:uncharacterized protein (DUF2235 family)
LLPTRAAIFYDVVAPEIRTPRDVIRMANSLSVTWPAIGTEVDCADYLIGIWDAVAAIGWQRFFPDWTYDRHFTPDVQYARHLQSIDEGRKDFKRVPWGGSGTVKWPDRKDEPEQFDQIWFAGNHADVGGSYPENESRLSDIALQWMVEFIAEKIPDAVCCDCIRRPTG